MKRIILYMKGFLVAVVVTIPVVVFVGVFLAILNLYFSGRGIDMMRLVLDSGIFAMSLLDIILVLSGFVSFVLSFILYIRHYTKN